MKVSTFFLFGFMLPAKNAMMIAIAESTNSNTDHLKTKVKTNSKMAATNKTPSLGPKLIYGYIIIGDRFFLYLRVLGNTNSAMAVVLHCVHH